MDQFNIPTLNEDGRVRASQIEILPGMLQAYAGASSPSADWLMCDGSAVSRTTYAELFAVIGTTYGSGNGSTTFNLPDLRGRVPVGVDGAAGRVSANDALGQAGGAESVALTGGQLGGHTHVVGRSQGVAAGSDYTVPTTGFPAAYETASAGLGQAHNNLQPYLVVNYLIRAR